MNEQIFNQSSVSIDQWNLRLSKQGNVFSFWVSDRELASHLRILQQGCISVTIRRAIEGGAIFLVQDTSDVRILTQACALERNPKIRGAAKYFLNGCAAAHIASRSRADFAQRVANEIHAVFDKAKRQFEHSEIVSEEPRSVTRIKTSVVNTMPYLEEAEPSQLNEPCTEETKLLSKQNETLEWKLMRASLKSMVDDLSHHDLASILSIIIMNIQKHAA